MKDNILDDARTNLLAKVRQACAMSEEERVLAGPRLFAGVCERMKEGLRDENPDADVSTSLIARQGINRVERL
jgi:hypothetical protein